MLELARAGDGAGDRRMGDDVLEEELAPARDPEIRRPRRELPIPNLLEQQIASTAERHGGHDRDLAPRGEREDLGLHRPVAEGVIHLHEVHRVLAQALEELRILPRADRGDADVAYASLFLQVRHHGHHRLDTVDVMNEEQIHLLQPLHGALETLYASRTHSARRTELGGDEHLLAESELTERLADLHLAVAVAGCRIDDGTAELVHALENAADVAVRRAPELIGAHADDGNLLPARGNGLRNEGCLVVSGAQGRRQRRRQSDEQAGLDHIPP